MRREGSTRRSSFHLSLEKKLLIKRERGSKRHSHSLQPLFNMMSRSIPKKLLIVGGSGFVGSHLCKEAIQSGWEVTSLSRHGKSKLTESIPSESNAHWTQKVKWIAGDVNDLSTYVEELKTVSAVIHSVGVLFENINYQNLALHPISTLQDKLYSGGKDELQYNRTYTQVNRDTALVLASNAAQFPNIKTFCYLSAAHDVPMFIPKGYINAKIEAENILKTMNQFKVLIFRPGGMFSLDRPISVIGSAFMAASNLVSILPYTSQLMPWMAVKPLQVDTVAKSILQGILKSTQFPLDEVPSSSDNYFIYEVSDMKTLAEAAHE